MRWLVGRRPGSGSNHAVRAVGVVRSRRSGPRRRRPARPGPQRRGSALRPLPVAEDQQCVAGVYPDPEVVGPSGHVLLDLGQGRVGQAGPGQCHRDLAVEHAAQTGIDRGQGVADGHRLGPQAGAAEVCHEVDQPVGQEVGQVRLLSQGNGEVVGAAGEPAGCLDDEAGAVGQFGWFRNDIHALWGVGELGRQTARQVGTIDPATAAILRSSLARLAGFTAATAGGAGSRGEAAVARSSSSRNATCRG